MLKKFEKVKIQDLEYLAKEVFSLLEEFFKNEDRTCIVFLNGDLGAGKTTFTKKLGEKLGILEDIISPTFVLRKDYENMIHVDGYRFEKAEEGKSLELERELYQKNKVIIIEWPERFVEAINLKADISIDFKVTSPEEREVSIKS